MIGKKYQPGKIETYWQKIWEEVGLYKPDLESAKKPFYNLMMFPYPSAEGMHVGNMYAFTGADVYGRFKRMQGYDVFEPIGLDGFGIHSENYAIKIGRHPKEQAKISQENFYRQLRATGNGYDWSRTVETYDPSYYKWTQWIFIQLFKAGLAYRKKASVNWCPVDKTVLADEQVIDDKCERCGSIVEKKELEQWFFKITDYADRLLDGLSRIDWTEKVKIAQRNWIGRKEGINISYEVEGSDEKIVCFTTRPDTNFGATFIVIGPEYPLIYKITKKGHLDSVEKYVMLATKQSEADRIGTGRKKTGVFTGSYAINNLNGKRLPIWVSDFVLGNVGTGAVVGVPGHDIRDFEFAKEFDLPIIRVVVGTDGDSSPITRAEQVQEEEGKMINSQFLNGLDIHEATKKIMDYLEEKGWGKRVTSYHLRDWLISRQRYWGPPIPMIYCPKCGWQPVPEEQLPVLLPDVKDWKPLGTGESPLANYPEFYNVACPECGAAARRETDVSDTFLDSSWYFLRYLGTDRDDVPFPSKAFNQGVILNSFQDPREMPKQVRHDKKGKNISGRVRWLPVSMYIGGAEHSVLHLLYTRFLTMVFHDLGLADFDEPFPRFFAHGLLIKEGGKMSKSRGNVAVPDEYIKKYGADTLRTYLMFLGPFSQGGDFYDSSIAGIHRFLNRVYNIVTAHIQQSESKSAKKSLAHSDGINPSDGGGITKKLHATIKKVTEDIEGFRYNTAIAALMELLNYIQKYQNNIKGKHLEQFLLMLAPFSPHIAEELWQKLRTHFAHQKYQFHSIHLHPWPKYDPKELQEDQVTIVVQVNGKVRDQLEVRSEKLEVRNEIESMAKERDKIKRHLEGRKIKRVVYVEGKIINFVTE